MVHFRGSPSTRVLMDRRDFLTATAVAAVSPIPSLDALAPLAPRQYFELRRYHLLPGPKQRAFTTFVGDVAIPAMNRAGVGKVGAFALRATPSMRARGPRFSTRR